MQQTSIRLRAARLGTVLRAIANIKPDNAVTMLAYASVGLIYPGEAPHTTEHFAKCSNLLTSEPWMREPAFEFLSNLAGSAWPYVIAQWDELTQLMRLDICEGHDPAVYAPHAHAKLHAITSMLCSKPFCVHPLEDHAFDRDKHSGRCSVAGCPCTWYKAPVIHEKEAILCNS